MTRKPTKPEKRMLKIDASRAGNAHPLLREVTTRHLIEELGCRHDGFIIYCWDDLPGSEDELFRYNVKGEVDMLKELLQSMAAGIEGFAEKPRKRAARTPG